MNNLLNSLTAIITGFLILFFADSAFSACSTPISRTNNSPNSVLTSTKYNLDINTVYTHTNNMDGDCIQDTSLPKTKLEAGYKDISVTSITTTYTALSTDETIAASASGGAFTITLPTAVGIHGRVYRIKKTDSTSNKVTVDANSAELIDGRTTYELYAYGQSIIIVSDNSGWKVISQDMGKKVEFFVRYNGGGETTVCSSSPCTTTEMYGKDWINGNVTRTGTGIYAFTTNAVFLASSWVLCTASHVATSGFGSDGTPAYHALADSSGIFSTTGFPRVWNAAGTAADAWGLIKCEGYAP